MLAEHPQSQGVFFPYHWQHEKRGINVSTLFNHGLWVLVLVWKHVSQLVVDDQKFLKSQWQAAQTAR